MPTLHWGDQRLGFKRRGVLNSTIHLDPDQVIHVVKLIVNPGLGWEMATYRKTWLSHRRQNRDVCLGLLNSVIPQRWGWCRSLPQVQSAARPSLSGQKAHVVTHMLRVPLYAWPAQTEALSTQTNMNRFCSVSLPADQDEGAKWDIKLNQSFKQVWKMWS